jgi:hypothetical protein
MQQELVLAKLWSVTKKGVGRALIRVCEVRFSPVASRNSSSENDSFKSC